MIAFFRYSVLIIIFFSSHSLYAATTDEVHAHNPWIREAPPGTKIHAAYMMFGNHTKKAFKIIKITSPVYKKIELHETKIVDGVSTMELVSELTIGPNEHFVMAPGGSHLMLFNPDRALKHGDIVPLVFLLSNGDSFSAEAKVKKVLGTVDSNKGESQHHNH